MWWFLLAGCGTPTKFDVPRSGDVFAVGSVTHFGPATHAPLKRLAMHQVPPVTQVEMVVKDPAVARLEGSMIHALKPGHTEIVVTGTVSGRTSTVTADVHVAEPVGHVWRRYSEDISSNVVVTVGDRVHYKVSMVDAKGRKLVHQGLEVPWPAEVVAHPGGSASVDVSIRPTEVGTIPMLGTPHVIEVVQTFDHAEWQGQHVSLFHTDGRRIHFGLNIVKQKSLDDNCTVLPYALGTNPFIVSFDGFPVQGKSGCQVELTVAGQRLHYTVP